MFWHEYFRVWHRGEILFDGNSFREFLNKSFAFNFYPFVIPKTELSLNEMKEEEKGLISGDIH